MAFDAESPRPPPRRFRGLPVAAVLGLEVPVAATGRSRLLGLALLDREAAGPGLLIPGCRGVHTFGMRFELDLVFLDSGMRVVGLRRAMPPRRLARCAGAASVLELPSPGEPGPNGKERGSLCVFDL